MNVAARQRSRALAARAARLGPRWVQVVAGGAPELPRGLGSPAVTVLLGGPPGGRADAAAATVRGAATALPVQSEAATGVLVACEDGEMAAACIPESARLLQPGGALLLLSAWTGAEVVALDAAFADCGLRTERRAAIRVAGAEPGALSGWLPALDGWRASNAGPDVRVECLVVAARPTTEVPMPTAGDILASMFVPWRRRGGSPE